MIPSGGRSSMEAVPAYNYKLRSAVINENRQQLNNQTQIVEAVKGEIDGFINSLISNESHAQDNSSCHNLVQIHALQNIKEVINELGNIVNKDNRKALFHSALDDLMRSDGSTNALGINSRQVFC